MNPAETRGLVLDALRRDLLGPLADPDGHYPGADVATLTVDKQLDRKDVTRLFVASDGQEVLVAETPTGRYITGALYPVMRTGDELELDRDQAPTTEDLTDPETAGELRAPEPVEATNAETTTEADLDTEGTLTDRPGRPSAMGVSFVVDARLTRLDIHVTGARYETFDVVVSGRPKTAWHRVPIDVVVPVDLPAPGTSAALTSSVTLGPVTLEVGLHARAKQGEVRTLTCYLVNRTTDIVSPLPCRVLFSATLGVPLPTGTLADYPQPDGDRSDEARTLRLLYAGNPVRAIGHGVDAVVLDTAGGHLVRTDAMPVAEVIPTTPDITDQAGPLAVGMAALGHWAPEAVATVERMLVSYRTWIAGQRAAAAAHMDGADLATATRHLEHCDAFADDIEAGWRLAQDGTVHTALRWASTAMAAQRAAYSARTRKVNLGPDKQLAIDPPAAPGRVAAWRPFQLAFVLANLPPTTDPTHPRRGAVDVIWMPTGGGKTEAYLGLAAFTMLHRRLLDPTAIGTAVLMRYTLRLLTAQQFQRAASLVCALEEIREQHPELGKARFSIGAWLGQASTPNRRKEALKQLADMTKHRGSNRRPFLLSRCPACATEMGTVLGGKVLGYGPAPAPDGGDLRMGASCPNPGCRFHLGTTKTGLPVFEVDEDIYRARPTFVVATVDKFAQLAWKDTPRALFGINADGTRDRPAPALIIQDELHLISGPLGSLVGLYESAIDQLCRHDGGAPPRIVAATATTRAYGRQAAALYDCPASDVRLVPPPALTAGDSFFATTDPALTPRAHVAVCATGVARFQHTEMRVLASLAHAVAAIEGVDPHAPVDPYWTNVVFFGSLRDLGQAKALLATDARSYAWRLVRSTGIRTGTRKTDGTRAAVRARTEVELTSASSGEAAQALDRLTKAKGDKGCVDLALATSVIEVGVDVERLGLLTIVRQPKTAAQYIQVAGRVGRNATTGPGLVVTVLNPLNSRDMSHYERFTSVHDRLYAAVEPASVTPFTGAALTRALRGALACVVRQTRPADESRVTPADLPRLSAAAAAIRDRIARIAPGATTTYDALASAALREAGQAAAHQLDWGDSRTSAFLRKPEELANPTLPTWAALMSLRSVDVDAAVHIDSAWLPGNRHRPTPTTASEEDAW